VVHESLHAQLEIRDHVIVGAAISFRAPYPVTDADEDYSVSAPTCPHGLAGSGSRADVARGALVTIPLGDILAHACGRSMTFAVEYVREAGGLPQPTRLGRVTVHEPPGTHAELLPLSVREHERWSSPTRSLHAPVELELLAQGRAACSRAYLLYPCYKGEVAFTAPYAASSSAGEYLIQGFAACKAGGRPETAWSVQRHVRARETIRTISLGMFVRTPACAAHEGFEVSYLNRQGPSAAAPHESVVLGTVTLSKAGPPGRAYPQR
jgi:hypothetical protein